MLVSAHTIAGVVKVFGLLCLLTGLGVCCWTAVSAVRSARAGRVANPPIRPPATRDPVDMWR
jgi:hypothetical protein